MDIFILRKQGSEAEAKGKEFEKIILLCTHMVGKLQSNKAKKQEVFDYIHFLDSHKLADILSKSKTANNL